jgi:hypothetical protein
MMSLIARKVSRGKVLDKGNKWSKARVLHDWAWNFVMLQELVLGEFHS